MRNAALAAGRPIGPLDASISAALELSARYGAEE